MCDVFVESGIFDDYVDNLSRVDGKCIRICTASLIFTKPCRILLESTVVDRYLCLILWQLIAQLPGRHYQIKIQELTVHEYIHSTLIRHVAFHDHVREGNCGVI
jgi:hypothetical protein